MENREFQPTGKFEVEEPSRPFLRKEFNEEIDELFQREFLDAVEKNDAIKIGQWKRRYLHEYPDQTESVEVLFGLNDFLRKDKKMAEDRNKEGYNIEESRFRDMTEYQFFFTHYLIENSGNLENLEKFWNVAQAVGEKSRTVKQLESLRRGLLTQAAVYKILEAIGEKPQLSHPELDAFHAIDLWAKNETPVQVKGSKAVEKPEVLESDQMAFPALQTKIPYESRYYNSKCFHDNARFRAKIKNYGQRIGKKLKGYMLIVPSDKIDPVTGEPSPELVEFFKGKLQAKKEKI